MKSKGSKGAKNGRYRGVEELSYLGCLKLRMPVPVKVVDAKESRRPCHKGQIVLVTLVLGGLSHGPWSQLSSVESKEQESDHCPKSFVAVA